MCCLSVLVRYWLFPVLMASHSTGGQRHRWLGHLLVIVCDWHDCFVCLFLFHCNVPHSFSISLLPPCLGFYTSLLLYPLVREQEKKDVNIFIVISCGECRVNSYSECVKQEVEGITLVLFSRFKEMQLFIDEKELSVTKVKITTLM